MIPKTKRQKEVFSLSQALPALTEEQIARTKAGCFDKVGYVYNNRIYCSECGKSIKYRKGTHIVCTHCGSHIRTTNTGYNPRIFESHCTLPIVCGEYQVMRNFIFRKFLYARKPIKYEHFEYSQNWISADGSETIVALPRCCFGYSWSAGGDMEVRGKQTYAYYNPYKCNGYIISQGNISSKLRKRGLTLPLMRKRLTAHSSLAKAILLYPDIEKVIKAGQTELTEYVIRNRLYEFRWLYAVNISNRHGYTIKDPSLWIDLLQLLEYHHLDTHNPHYICPTDLKEVHDILMRRKDRKENERKSQELIIKISKAEREYAVSKSIYMDIHISNGSIEVKPLKSVAEFQEEGKAMHHCVFSNEYYLKPDSLILSARKDGIRLETIEINLSSFTIVQSRGINNSQTAYHQQIIQLINNNINLIKERTHKVHKRETA